MTTTTTDGEAWDLWLDGPHPPAFNMAADEALLLGAPDRRRPLLRLYAWDRPAVSIGYIQRLDAAPPGFAVVRRPTGGGVVYHDHDVTYTAVFPPDHSLNQLDRLKSYDDLNRAVQNGLQRLDLDARLSDALIPRAVDRLTMVCFQHPTRYDILLNGRKVGGSAQRRVREGLLHQGSLHFGGPLPVPRNRLADALLDGFRDTLHVTFTPFTPDHTLLQRIAELEHDKYDNQDWNARR